MFKKFFGLGKLKVVAGSNDVYGDSKSPLSSPPKWTDVRDDDDDNGEEDFGILPSDNASATKYRYVKSDANEEGKDDADFTFEASEMAIAHKYTLAGKKNEEQLAAISSLKSASSKDSSAAGERKDAAQYATVRSLSQTNTDHGYARTARTLIITINNTYIVHRV